MARPDRLTGLDASFLHLERDSAHMHVGSVLVFDGAAPGLRGARRRRSSAGCTSCRATASGSRSCRCSRGGRCGSTTRTSTPATTCATPRCRAPAREEELKRLAGRLFSQRARPRQAAVGDLARRAASSGDRFALICKTHHALVDGVSGVDITTVLFDTAPEPARRRPSPTPWVPRPGAQRRPAARRRAARARHRARRDRARGARGAARAAPGARRGPATSLSALGALRLRRRGGAPPSPLNVHDRAAPALHLGRRRPRPVQGDQERARRHGQRRRARRSSSLALRALPARPRASTRTDSS